MQLFFSQELILSVSGFLPLTYDRSQVLNSKIQERLSRQVLRKVLTFVAICFLLGSLLYDTVLHVVAVLAFFIQAALQDSTSPSSTHSNSKPDLLAVLSNLLFCTIHLRGFLVLSLFFYQRQNFCTLKSDLIKLTYFQIFTG